MTMASIVEQMTTVYVFVDDYLKAHPRATQWRRSHNRAPAFTDAEVITIALLKGCLGVATLRHAYRYVAHNQPTAFPRLCSYRQWLARLHALSAVVGQLVQVAGTWACGRERLYLLDSLPVPICKPIRHGRVRLLCDEGACFGKARGGWYFGFKLHLLAHHTGALLAAILTPANWQDQEVALALALSVQGGVGVGDLGYRGRTLARRLATEAQLLLLTPQAAGERNARRALLSRLRQRVETSLSGLWSRFLDRVYARSWEGLWSAIKLTLLHFNLCQAGLLPP
jgi:Transposase DDE domain